MRIAGLFAGIGGIELPFHRAGHETVLLCDNWEPSQRVLSARFPGVPIVDDVRGVSAKGLPARVSVLTAGFPCTDLSQAGRTAGIHGESSGLVAQVFEILRKHRDVTWLVLENVRNMLVLEGGEAMSYLTGQLDALGFRWAYRLVDSRFTGVPQRRHRVILVASRDEDPRGVLFADDAGEIGSADLRHDAFGFYWTEGLRGLGWAVDAVPPLKGGSTVGIPSPPGIWIPGSPTGRRIVNPTIEQAEELQGFPAGWTEPAGTGSKNGPRWKLVGNAVTVGVSEWLVSRLERLGEPAVDVSPRVAVDGSWPAAAWGDARGAWRVDASTWPLRCPYRHLTDVVDPDQAVPLTERGARGFWQRTQRSNLRFVEDFLIDVDRHIEALRADGQPTLWAESA